METNEEKEQREIYKELEALRKHYYTNISKYPDWREEVYARLKKQEEFQANKIKSDGTK